MPRPKRLCVPGLPHHVVQRGNNKQATFLSDGDYVSYIDLLREAADQHDVKVHAFVLMTNHVHLMMTPSSDIGLSLTMQALGRSFVWRFNKKYDRSGTLWEGRFKCSLIDTDRYCLACYRYIDLNPVRAGIVAHPGDYRWSSYRHNAFGAPSTFLTPHSSYTLLGRTRQLQAEQYGRIVMNSLDQETLAVIRHGIRKQLPIGSNQFISGIQQHIGQQIGTGKIGRPKK
ncbi:MAG: transposase [Proteobacteria bacterium]|nr:transposase [Pseudomonadota bacterium]